ncbi:hypothetical protein PR202_gb06271 [Eleusine coracana subsp. coracana]|uniref:At1g61320/AtMIF1 LRR domain-containing protein n=1 Tax=Eleusine coracana subsp. coracana TaxID=191504 RepID=A0AAV5E8Y7_ELECO|nr:hypothetical protein PR202_gb06271 [Eleusine coracana subsp. coracana]
MARCKELPPIEPIIGQHARYVMFLNTPEFGTCPSWWFHERSKRYRVVRYISMLLKFEITALGTAPTRQLWERSSVKSSLSYRTGAVPILCFAATRISLAPTSFIFLAPAAALHKIKVMLESSRIYNIMFKDRKWQMAKKVKSSEMEPNELLVKRKRPSLQLSDLPVRVDAILEQHSGLVDKMEVSFSLLHNEHKEHLDKWVKFAIASKTKQLVFDFVIQHLAKEPYGFPFQLFDATTGSHLQSLKLGSVCLKQPATIKYLCPLLQVIELNFGLTTLEYEGSLIPLVLPSTLRNISIKSPDIRSALAYIFTGLPSTLPHLEMLTLRCRELKRATLSNKPLEFHSLRHLRLELDFVSLRKRRTDALDLACLLEAAPFMEMLEIHMWTDYQLKRYHKYNGELRSLPAHARPHLKLVNITGFYGQKDQLELALHILRISTTLEAMKIDPRPMVAATTLSLGLEDGICFVEGY